MELNARDVFFLMIRRLYVLILGIIIGGGLFFGYTYFLASPSYDCEVTMVVNADPTTTATQGTLNASKLLVSNYIALMKDYSFSETIKNSLDGMTKDYSVPEIRRSMTLTSVEDSQLLSVKVTTTDPQDSYNIAKQIEINAPVLLRSYFDNAGSISICRFAKKPYYPSGPNKVLNIFIGALIGFVIAFVTVLLKAMFDKRIKTEEDIQKLINYPILGTINKVEN